MNVIDWIILGILGISVRIVDGEERNMKITTPLDLAVAKMLLEEQK